MMPNMLPRVGAGRGAGRLLQHRPRPSRLDAGGLDRRHHRGGGRRNPIVPPRFRRARACSTPPRRSVFEPPRPRVRDHRPALRRTIAPCPPPRPSAGIFRRQHPVGGSANAEQSIRPSDRVAPSRSAKSLRPLLPAKSEPATLFRETVTGRTTGMTTTDTSYRRIAAVGQREGVAARRLLGGRDRRDQGSPLRRIRRPQRTADPLRGPLFRPPAAGGAARRARAGALPSARRRGAQSGRPAARWACSTAAGAIDTEAAYASTSWGLGQVMGSHWRSARLSQRRPPRRPRARPGPRGRSRWRAVSRRGPARGAGDGDFAGFARALQRTRLPHGTAMT